MWILPVREKKISAYPQNAVVTNSVDKYYMWGLSIKETLYGEYSSKDSFEYKG
jgi:hypothetical protein